MRRRTFLLGALGAGGALVVGWSVLPPRSRMGSRETLANFVAGDGVALNGWVSIANDGGVIVAVPRSEMGQGVYTALPMLVAEEMDVPLAQVRVAQAPIDAIFGNVAMLTASLPFHPDNADGVASRTARWFVAKLARELGLQVTGGSSSVRDAWLPMREAGAAARAMLVAAAARQWGVAAGECRVEAGVVRHDGGKQARFGELVQALSEVPVPSSVRLKDAKQFKLVGTPAARLDTPGKVDGSARFGTDIRIPEMLYAVVRMCPVPGGQIARIESDEAMKQPGVVKVARFDGAAGCAPGIVVVAKTTWQAKLALDKVRTSWIDGANSALDSRKELERMRRALKEEKGFTFHARGDASAALKVAATVVDAEYSAPWLAHATLEPMNCTAQFTDDGRLKIWAPTQVPSVLRHVAARYAGIDASRVELEVTLLGGGFGRRLESDFVIPAIAAAREARPRPVKVLWSREEDMTHDFYRPAAVARLKAGLDAAGKPLAWVTKSVSDAITPQFTARAYPALAVDTPDKTTAEGLFDQSYEFAHRDCVHVTLKTPVPIGYWRSVGHSHNAFFTESFIDELAHAAKRDPFEFRRDLLQSHPRYRAVLDLAAEKAGWTGPLPAGFARGIALHESFGSIVAQVAEVSLRDGTPQVHRVVCAIDCGIVVNPRIVAQQVAGSVVFGLTAALHGEITFKQGRVEQHNFPDYEMVRMAESPRVETHIVASTEPPGGVGEPATPPLAPAVGNALFALTGKRLRSLPLRLA
ncbi:MAG: xanthine dehydrogenase family protein molybdopterin-binding subunit [Betaproteobacteria bacterium]|nr:xanthine dehydrogenase family protein molybdopterin-binding subunit [Betaproteobacteria bacterium]